MPLGSASKSIVTFTDVGDVVGPGVEGGVMYTGAIVGDSADAKGQQGAAATEILNRFCPPLYHHYCHYHHKIDRDPVVVDAEAIASLFFLAWKVRPHDDFPTDIDKVRRIFWYTLYCHQER